VEGVTTSTTSRRVATGVTRREAGNSAHEAPAATCDRLRSGRILSLPSAADAPTTADAEDNDDDGLGPLCVSRHPASGLPAGAVADAAPPPSLARRGAPAGRRLWVWRKTTCRVRAAVGRAPRGDPTAQRTPGRRGQPRSPMLTVDALQPRKTTSMSTTPSPPPGAAGRLRDPQGVRRANTSAARRREQATYDPAHQGRRLIAIRTRNRNRWSNAFRPPSPPPGMPGGMTMPPPPPRS
jgi:hypothetical protein